MMISLFSSNERRSTPSATSACSSTFSPAAACEIDDDNVVKELEEAEDAVEDGVAADVEEPMFNG